MLYTIGYTESYDRYFQEQDQPCKLGKGFDYEGRPYEGGSIWLTREEAESYLQSTGQSLYSVYGVDCEIGDTEFVEGQPYRNLLKTSPLIKLDLVAG